MIVSKNLLSFVAPGIKDISVENITNAFMDIGIEVESIFHHPKNDGLIPARIISTQKNAEDKNFVCVVQTDKKKYKIVCGSSKIVVGTYALLAPPGAKLYNGKIIKSKEIDGVISEGMLCGYQEITNHNEFLSNAELHEIIMMSKCPNDYIKYLGLDDVIFDITLPANRPNLNSVAHLALELCGKLKIEDKIKNIDFSALNIVPHKNYKNNKSVLAFNTFEVDNKFNKSKWKNRGLLMNNHVKTSYSILDSANLISLLTNVPLHCYDAEKIKGKLTAKKLENNCEFKALNGIIYKLEPGDIVVCDDNGVQCLGGIIGGEDSKVTKTTKKVIIECAMFDCERIARTEARIKTGTKAAKDSSKLRSTQNALLACNIIEKMLPEAKHKFKHRISNNTREWINISQKKLERFTSLKISKKEIIKILERYSFKTSLDLNLKVKAPKYRFDIKNEYDVFEEILKDIGIEKLNPEAVQTTVIPKQKSFEHEKIKKIKNIMLENFFNETLTYNLCSAEEKNKFNVLDVDNNNKIICNHKTKEHMVSSVLFSLIKVYLYNVSYKLDLIPIFNLQKIYFNKDDFIFELSGLISSDYKFDSLGESSIKINLISLKGILNTIAHKLNLKLCYKPIINKYFYENECLGIYLNKKQIGVMGKLSKMQLKQVGLKNIDLYSFTIDTKNLTNNSNKKWLFKNISSNQLITKDVNFEIKNEQDVENIINKIIKIKNIVDVKLINTYNNTFTFRYCLDNSFIYSNEELISIGEQVKNVY